MGCLSEQVEALLAMNRDGVCTPKVPNLAVVLLETQSARIADLERERDEARAEGFKAGMMRAAEIADERDNTNPFAPLDTPDSWLRQQIATAICAEAERGGE